MATMNSLEISGAVEYVIINIAANTAGGQRFEEVIGSDYAKRTLDLATQFIWRLLQQENNPSDRKNYQKVSLIVKNINGIVHVSNNEIHLNATYMGSYSGDLKWEVTGVLYHAMSLVWQWNGNGEASKGLVTGIADYVRLRAQYDPSHWVKAGAGGRWDQGYDVTARFLEYCEGLRHGVVADLNKKMRYGYTNGYFIELLGKPVDQLWKDYKAQYGDYN